MLSILTFHMYSKFNKMIYNVIQNTNVNENIDANVVWLLSLILFGGIKENERCLTHI